MVILPSWTLKWCYKNASLGWGWRDGDSVGKQTCAHGCWQVQSWISWKNRPKGCAGWGCPHTPAWKPGHIDTHTMSLLGTGFMSLPSVMLSCKVKFCALCSTSQNNLVILINNIEVCKWLCYSNFVFSQTDTLAIMETKCIWRCLPVLQISTGSGYWILLWTRGSPALQILPH